MTGALGEGVTVGVSLERSCDAVFFFDLPRSEPNDFFTSDSFGLGGCLVGSGVSDLGASCSLNWAASGWDCDGVSKTATSPTCFCAWPSAAFASATGSRYQKAHPEAFACPFGGSWAISTGAVLGKGASA